jgi:RHH-type transcriptional regulator, rel operon repressor / antitoxin RelB
MVAFFMSVIQCIAPSTLMCYNVLQRGDSMAISIRMSDKEMELIRKYAALNGATVSEVVRRAILEKIEDEFDIFVYEQAMDSLEKNPKTYTLEEAREILDLK